MRLSESFWSRLSTYIGIMPIAAIFGLCVFVANIEIKDLDLWLHLGVGKYITEHGVVPLTDMLSATREGAVWNNHEWLFQVIVYNIYAAFGVAGLQTMQITLACVTMLILLLLGYNKDKQITSIFLLALMYLIFQQRFTFRPDLYSLLFFSLYIYILAIHIDKKWSLWALGAIQVLWVNMHGYFFFGPLFVFIGLGSEWLRRHVRLPYEWNDSGRLTDEEYGRIARIFLVTLGASLINPQFIEGALYPVKIFFSLGGDSKIFFEYIQELARPITKNDWMDVRRFMFYKTFIVISFASFFFNRRRIDISALIFWVIFLVFSLKAIRNTAYFALAAYLVTITNTLNIDCKDIIPYRIRSARLKYAGSICVKVAILAWLLNYMSAMSVRGYYDFDKFERKSEYGGVAQRLYADKAVRFLKDSGISGRIFNDFNSGAYLVGHVFPKIKVFIDGRTELYGPTFFKDIYVEIWQKENIRVLKEVLDQYQLNIALLNSTQTDIPSAIFKYFHQSPEWALVYFDYDGAVYLKRIAEFENTIAAHEIDLSQWQAPDPQLLRIGVVNVEPYRQYFRAFSLNTLGYYDQALAECFVALDIDPGYANVYRLMGQIYAAKKSHARAFHYYRQAAMLNPGDIQTYYYLLMSYMDNGLYEAAMERVQQLRQKRPLDPRPYFFLAKAYAHQKQYGKIDELIERGLELGPENVGDVLMVGDVALQNGDGQTALQLYEKVKNLAEDHPDVYFSLAKVSHALGQKDKALLYVNLALKKEPFNEKYEILLREMSSE